MVKEHSIIIRQAVGIYKQVLLRFVSMKLGVNIRTIQRWWRLFKNGLSLENQGGRGFLLFPYTVCLKLQP